MHPHRQPRRLAAVLIALGGCVPSAAAADPPVAREPLKCWWRTSTAAVRIAEPFSLLLTCAIDEANGRRVVVDQGKLDGDAVALAPFEVVGGGELTESRDGDAHLPVRVLSLVPADARTIREPSAVTFAELDEAAFDASLMRTAGFAIAALGAIGLLAALASAARTRRPAGAQPSRLAEHVVLRHVQRELQDVQRSREAEGWNTALVVRALAAVRVVAAYVAKLEPVQRPVDRHDPSSDGVLVLSARDGRRTIISSAVTAARVRKNPDAEAIADAMQSLTRGLYGREAIGNPAALDAALGAAQAATSHLTHEHGWLARTRSAWTARWQRPWSR